MPKNHTEGTMIKVTKKELEVKTGYQFHLLLQGYFVYGFICMLLLYFLALLP